MKGTIISGFPGIGKTTLSKKYPNEVIDMESSKYKWIHLDNKTASLDPELIKGTENRIINPNWPNNYLNDILSNIQQYKYVLISQGDDIRNILDENQIDYMIAFPSTECKSEYLERYKSRGNNEKFISLIEENFDSWINKLLKSAHRKIIIRPGYTLEDEMQNLGMIGQTKTLENR